MKIVVVTSVRNEAPFLLEWVLYNRIIGFTDVIVYYNDCSDGTDVLARAMADAGLIVAVENRGLPDVAPQVAAFMQARALPQLREADWAIAIDVDEFINVKCGQGLLSDLFFAVPDADAIMIQMRHFGSAHRIFMQDDLVVRQFHLASREDHSDNMIVKTLHKMKPYFKSIGMHMPFLFDRPQVMPRMFNGSGLLVPPEVHGYQRLRKIPDGWAGADVVQLNHYAVRSLDQFLVKRRRGSGTGMKNRFNKEYWHQRDANDVIEDSILRHVPMMEKKLAEAKQSGTICNAIARAAHLNSLEVMLSIRDAPPFAFEVARVKAGAS